jgi:glucosyl-dolichyl phosphate glucuronosyltransferase
MHASPLASVVIPTYNRATLLGKTLDRLAELRPQFGAWDVVVVDNNSTDNTSEAVGSRIGAFPVPLRYVFERAQGRSFALNAGIAASTAPLLVFTDDDVLVGDRWLDAAVAPLLDAGPIDYTGGPVRPIWEAPRPAWLAGDRADLWGTIAILDYGPEPFMFEERRRVPLGANMAVRRDLFNRIGPFNGRLGRCGEQLLGQEVPEFLSRSRAAGARGLYAPEMVVDHHVPAGRLTKSYFRRWWFGKGVSRAQLDRLRPTTELGVDLTQAPHVGGLPVFMWRSAAGDVRGWLTSAFDEEKRFRHETMLWYFAGYLSARRRESEALHPATAN